MHENENAYAAPGEYCPIRGLIEKLTAAAAGVLEVSEKEKCIKELCAWYDGRDYIGKCAITEMGRAAQYITIRGL